MVTLAVNGNVSDILQPWPGQHIARESWWHQNLASGIWTWSSCPYRYCLLQYQVWLSVKDANEVLSNQVIALRRIRNPLGACSWFLELKILPIWLILLSWLIWVIGKWRSFLVYGTYSWHQVEVPSCILWKKMVKVLRIQLCWNESQ